MSVFELYVSGFFPWLGMTIGLAIVSRLAVELVVGCLAAFRGTPVRIGDVIHNHGDQDADSDHKGA